MKTFLMICYVSAVFGPLDGKTFQVTPAQIGVFIEAPEWIKKTVMFKWLLNDKSIKVADEQISLKDGENDPMKGMSAEGKDEKITKAAEQKVVEELKAEEKPAGEPEGETGGETGGETEVKTEEKSEEPKPAKAKKEKNKDDAK